ncbi:MAG: hypothetical protein O6499_00160 [Candidatus Dadabacteria bacterium]|nr:hypothetical protein [Candidatus Dadabacteria bacterium]
MMGIEIGVDRPAQVALLDAIRKVIDEVSDGTMTTIEVLGVLDVIGRQIYKETIEAE